MENNQFNASSGNQFGQWLSEQNYNQAVNNANVQNNMYAQQGKGLIGMAGNILGDLFNKQAPIGPANGEIPRDY